MAAHVDDGIARWASPFVRNVRQTIIIYSDVFHARFQATALIRAGFLDYFLLYARVDKGGGLKEGKYSKQFHLLHL